MEFKLEKAHQRAVMEEIANRRRQQEHDQMFGVEVLSTSSGDLKEIDFKLHIEQEGKRFSITLSGDPAHVLRTAVDIIDSERRRIQENRLKWHALSTSKQQRDLVEFSKSWGARNWLEDKKREEP